MGKDFYEPHISAGFTGSQDRPISPADNNFNFVSSLMKHKIAFSLIIVGMVIMSLIVRSNFNDLAQIASAKKIDLTQKTLFCADRSTQSYSGMSTERCISNSTSPATPSI